MEFQDVSPQLEKLAGEFQYREPPDFLIRLQDLISYVLRAVADFLKQFKLSIPGISDTSAVGNAMQLLIVLVGLLSLGIILFLMSTRMKQLRARAQMAKRGAMSLEEILDAQGWKLKAEELASEKLFRDASRAVYMSAIYLLDEKQVLAFGPTRSNYEYWYALSGKQNLQKSFRGLTDIVEEIWFGNRVAQESDYIDCLNMQRQIEEELNQSLEVVAT